MILMAAIEERRELVQHLWFYGHTELASEHYAELRQLRARLREVENANTRHDNPGASGDSQTE